MPGLESCKLGELGPDMLRERRVVRSQTYEITFAGQAGAVLRTEFDDCEVKVGHGTTTLRAAVLDQAALSGLLERISSLHLELVHLHRVAPHPDEE